MSVKRIDPDHGETDRGQGVALVPGQLALGESPDSTGTARRAARGPGRPSGLAVAPASGAAFELPTRYVSIDPGSIHCAVAYWEVDSEPSPAGPRFTLRLVEVTERTPDALYAEIRGWANEGIGLAICEDWKLRKGQNAAGDRLESVKTIGVIEYICRRSGIPIFLQDASVKAYAYSWLRNVGVEARQVGSNEHKRDAVVHGLYLAWRDRGWQQIGFACDSDREGKIVSTLPWDELRGRGGGPDA